MFFFAFHFIFIYVLNKYFATSVNILGGTNCLHLMVKLFDVTKENISMVLSL